jgi:type II secretory pathway component PulJ
MHPISHHPSNRRAMTLIEIVVASALLVLVAAGMMDLAVRVMREQAHSSRQGALDAETAQVIEALTRDLARAKQVRDFAPARTSHEPRQRVLSLLVDLPQPGGQVHEQTVEYALEGSRVLRSHATGSKEKNAWGTAQVLARNATRFVLERHGALLHVEVVCSSGPADETIQSALKTDFFMEEAAK